jgi:truncated hemoglobin YjbI
MSGTDGSIPTLVDWSGGPPAMARLVVAFYDRVERDDLLSPFLPGWVTTEHRRNVALWWTEVSGGPSDYTDRLGGYDRMRAHHRGLSITAAQRLRSANDHEPGRRRRRTDRGPRVPGRAGQLPGVGNQAGGGQLPAGCDAARARTGAPMGLGCGPALPALSR